MDKALSCFIKAILCLAAKDRTHAIDILKLLIQGGSKTHRPVGHKTRDVVVADAADHAGAEALECSPHAGDGPQIQA